MIIRISKSIDPITREITYASMCNSLKHRKYSNVSLNIYTLDAERINVNSLITREKLFESRTNSD
jgi:hypothetical protein